MELPEGILFPIGHNRVILEQAMAGERIHEGDLFDGSHEAGYYRAATFIGPRATTVREAPRKLLGEDLPNWPVRLAYFRYDDEVGVPDFEVGYTLFSNGVIDDLLLDYQEFGLIGRLVELHYLDRPDCGE